jgi:hypothetical protein
MPKNSFLSGVDLTNPHISAQLRSQLGDAGFAKLQKGQRQIGRDHKYGVSPREERTIDGIVFASKFEGRCYVALRELVPASHLHLQPRFLLQEGYNLIGKKERAIYYVADFLLGPERLQEDDPLVPGHFVIDAKGFKTADFLLKKKLFEYRYQHRLYMPKNLKELGEIIAAYESVRTQIPAQQV